MKKLLTYILTAAAVIALAAAILTARAVATDKNTEALKERQEEVHAAAELLRELGVGEEDVENAT